MAPAKGLRGVSAVVLVADQPVPEYELPDQTDTDPRKVIRYIEARAGQVFKIKYTIQQGTTVRGEAIATHVYVDGSPVSKLYWAVSLVERENNEQIVEGQTVGSEIHGFCFNTIHTSEASDYYEGEEDLLVDVGTIAVRFSHAKLKDLKPKGLSKANQVGGRSQSTIPSSPAATQADGVSNDEQEAISEKALVKGQALEGKQALSHRIAYVKPVKRPSLPDLFLPRGGQPPPFASSKVCKSIFTVPQPPKRRVTTIPIGKGLVYEIEFRYRSIHAIKSMIEDVDITTLPAKKLAAWQKQLKEVNEKAAAQTVQDKAKRKREKEEQTPRERFILAPDDEIVELD